MVFLVWWGGELEWEGGRDCGGGIRDGNCGVWFGQCLSYGCWEGFPRPGRKFAELGWQLLLTQRSEFFW
ncbi:hypothetical protein AWZ94_22595 [Shigella sonnei]|nr:hypothetical protein AWZ94_22595 [Shigella sonnei]